MREGAVRMRDSTEYDLIIVGSGGAGMTAALAAHEAGLRTVIVEKNGRYGGSTARSGGGVWIPGNSVLRKAGIQDTRADAAAYLRHVAGPGIEQERIDAYLDHGPTMLDLVLERTPLKLQWVPGYSDYYPEGPGGRPGGRSVEPVPMDSGVLGELRRTLEKPYMAGQDAIPLTQADFRKLNLILRDPRSMLTALRLAGRMTRARVRRRKVLTMGRALAAGLRVGLAQAGVPIELNTPLRRLVVSGGAVRGVVVDSEGEEVTLTARRGVLLASGGFERNAELRKTHQREPISGDWTVGAESNTGDGLLACLEHAELDVATELLEEAWWGPSIPFAGGTYFCLAERTLPGSIMVNGSGERFGNEAAPYVDAVHAMYGEPGGPARNMPTWLVFDQRYRNRYIFAGLPPRQPLPRKWLASGVVQRASSIGELAKAIEVPAERLEASVKRFNGFAESGVDEDFGRGTSHYDSYYSDPRVRPNSSLAALRTPPFYAVQLVPGDLGTKGGVRTDAQARVLRTDGSPIEGLYAAGNVSAALMGGSYAGPGATIGPAMTFGYLAAKHAAGHSLTVTEES